MRACTDHKAMVRKCKYELPCGEEDLNQDIWRIYVLQAKECENIIVVIELVSGDMGTRSGGSFSHGHQSKEAILLMLLLAECLLRCRLFPDPA